MTSETDGNPDSSRLEHLNAIHQTLSARFLLSDSAYGFMTECIYRITVGVNLTDGTAQVICISPDDLLLVNYEHLSDFNEEWQILSEDE